MQCTVIAESRCADVYTTWQLQGKVDVSRLYRIGSLAVQALCGASHFDQRASRNAIRCDAPLLKGSGVPCRAHDSLEPVLNACMPYAKRTCLCDGAIEYYLNTGKTCYTLLPTDWDMPKKDLLEAGLKMKIP